jgi:hypothetical protein
MEVIKPWACFSHNASKERKTKLPVAMPRVCPAPSEVELKWTEKTLESEE